jgi:predicted lipoprotein with Yx(FWY)xxD motif
VNGVRAPGDPRHIPLGAHDVLQLAVGPVQPFHPYEFTPGTVTGGTKGNTMQTRIVVGGVLAALALGATGVGVAVAGSGGTAAAAPAYGSGYGAAGSPSAPSAPPAPSAATVTNRSTNLGPTLVDGTGRTLYLFESDTPTTSTCNGSCASVWPPASAASTPHATGGTRVDLLGTLRRTDGTTQLTYKGHPLYYFAGDAKPGDTTGQGLDQFGAKWYALTPGGGTIDTD